MKKPLQLAAAVVLGAALLPGAAAALCSKPILPYCASDGELGGRYVTPGECRRSVEEHLAELARYRDCLAGAIEGVDGEVDRLNRLLSHSPAESGSGARAAG